MGVSAPSPADAAAAAPPGVAGVLAAGGSCCAAAAPLLAAASSPGPPVGWRDWAAGCCAAAPASAALGTKLCEVSNRCTDVPANAAIAARQHFTDNA